MTQQTPSSPVGSDKPIWTRWWMIAIYVLVGLGVIANLVGDDTEDPEVPLFAETTSTSTRAETTITSTAPTTTTTIAPTTTTTIAPTTTTTVPPTTTTAVAIWESFTIEGSGDDFFEFLIPGGDAAVLEISHRGSSNFAVITYTEDNERLDLLVNEIGTYDGRVPVNFLLGEEVGLIEITASGPWTVTAIPLSELEVLPDQAAGRGDDTVIMDVSSPMLRATHDGQSNFVVLAWSDQRDLLVNEIGAYDATVRSPTGTVVFQITADGNWMLTSG